MIDHDRPGRRQSDKGKGGVLRRVATQILDGSVYRFMVQFSLSGIAERCMRAPSYSLPSPEPRVGVPGSLGIPSSSTASPPSRISVASSGSLEATEGLVPDIPASLDQVVRLPSSSSTRRLSRDLRILPIRSSFLLAFSAFVVHIRSAASRDCEARNASSSWSADGPSGESLGDGLGRTCKVGSKSASSARSSTSIPDGDATDSQLAPSLNLGDSRPGRT